MHMWVPASSLQGARLKPCRVFWSGVPLWAALEPVLRPFLTTYSWKSGMFPINFDLWNNRLSCMSFLAGITNANYCEDNKQFWSRLTRKFIFIFQQWHTWSFMLAVHHLSACINIKGSNMLLSCFIQTWHSTLMSRDNQLRILSCLQCSLLVSLGWKSRCIVQKGAADDGGCSKQIPWLIV